MIERLYKIAALFLFLCILLAEGLTRDVSHQNNVLRAASVDPVMSTTQLLFRNPVNGQPSLSLFSESETVTRTVDFRQSERYFNGELQSARRATLNSEWLQPAINRTPNELRFVDHWRTLFQQNFSLPVPSASPLNSVGGSCRLSELSRTDVDLQPSSQRATQYYPGWLTQSGGRTTLGPQFYQGAFDLWLICGPFHTGHAQRLLLRFQQRLQIDAQNDSLFLGVSYDGRDFRGIDYSGDSAKWHEQQIWLSGYRAQSELWLGWNFRSKAGLRGQQGAWIANPQLLAYEANQSTLQRCTVNDPGIKGVMLPAYDPTTGGTAPILRSGDVVALNALLASGAHWVRLDFVQRNGFMDIPAYDRIVDTLCAAGISVLGLVNDQTLVRQDFDDPNSAQSYRQEFVRQAAFLAEYFRGRVDTWEIWNEPNYHEGAYVPPELYAPLLKSSAEMIRRVNPRAKIVFGGLASAWLDSYQYLEKVYGLFDAENDSVHPFDVLAVHPYADGWRHGGPHPERYLKARDGNANDPTILDRFVRLMAERGDAGKKIWVTEIGWNSSRGAANSPWCLQQVVVSEREQAEYLTAGFDVLFKDVMNTAVEKVFWYQYMDVGITELCKWSPPGRIYDAWYGLYRGDKVTPKPLQCAFRSYPDPCPAS